VIARDAGDAERVIRQMLFDIGLDAPKHRIPVRRARVIKAKPVDRGAHHVKDPADDPCRLAPGGVSRRAEGGLQHPRRCQGRAL
jgi:hypothetical protein